uniref:Uncharacterized protein n=1 Tax=Arundo donax TaxID=35708 RepID=A0A0A9EXZ8_ARUDO
MAQMHNQREGGEHAMEERYHVDLDQAIDLFEVDTALLMELTEDLAPPDMPDGDVDRLSHVIQSLEAEIINGGDMAAAMVDKKGMVGVPNDNAGRLEDMLLDFDDYESGSFGYWPEVPLVGNEIEGWYSYTDEGSVVGYEMIDHQYYCMEGSVEQVYSPLWE